MSSIVGMSARQTDVLQATVLADVAIVLVVGVVLMLMGSTRTAAGGRRHYFQAARARSAIAAASVPAGSVPNDL